MPITYYPYPTGYTELLLEIQNNSTHAPLAHKLAAIPATEFGERIGCIAAYCGIALDGTFTEKECLDLIDICYKTLRDMGSLIIH